MRPNVAEGMSPRGERYRSRRSPYEHRDASFGLQSWAPEVRVWTRASAKPQIRQMTADVTNKTGDRIISYLETRYGLRGLRNDPRYKLNLSLNAQDYSISSPLSRRCGSQA